MFEAEALVPVIVAIIAAAGAIIAAVLASTSAKQARRANRIDEVETMLDKYKKDNHLLYLYNRQLVDHIYRDLGPPPPSPPDGLFA